MLVYLLCEEGYLVMFCKASLALEKKVYQFRKYLSVSLNLWFRYHAASYEDDTTNVLAAADRNSKI